MDYWLPALHSAPKEGFTLKKENYYYYNTYEIAYPDRSIHYTPLLIC